MQCIPGKIDLTAVVCAVNHNASQLAYRGLNKGVNPSMTMSSGCEYGDPNSTPIVFVRDDGDIQIAMVVSSRVATETSLLSMAFSTLRLIAPCARS